MRVFYYCIVLFIAMGCSQSITLNDIQQLNGYWEIEKVEFPNGQIKEYSISTTIDYIELDQMKGFRKKVQPQLNGAYKTSNDAESFDIVRKENTFLFFYGKGTAQWEETLIQIDKNEFAVRNVENKIYYYKRFEPLLIDP